MYTGLALAVASVLTLGASWDVSPQLAAAVKDAARAENRPVETVEFEDTMPLGDDLLTVLVMAREQGGMCFYLMLLDKGTLKPTMVVDYPPTHRETPDGHTEHFMYGIDRAVEGSLTLARNECDYGGHLGKVKYFIDLEQRKVLAKQESFPFIVDAVSIGDGAVYCAGRLPRVPRPERRDDWYRQYIMVVPNPAPGEYGTPVFVSEVDAKEVPCLTRAGESETAKVVFEGPQARCELREGGWAVTPLSPPTDGPTVGPFPVPNAYNDTVQVTVVESALSRPLDTGSIRLLLVEESPCAPSFGSELIGGIGVVDSGECSYHPIPVPEYAVFERYRQDAIERASDGYKFHMVNGIGGYEIIDGEVIFGTSFYDGEGEGGIGAVGRFDVKERAYQFDYPPALRPWSTSALLVDGPYLWFGLYERPEGAYNPGGLLRYDTRDESTAVYDVPYVIYSIRKNGDGILMGTEDGLYILADGHILRANYTVTSEGKPATYLDRVQ